MEKLIEKIAIISLIAAVVLVACFLLILIFNCSCIFTDVVTIVAKIASILVGLGILVCLGYNMYLLS